jgi:hypothetical protein
VLIRSFDVLASFVWSLGTTIACSTVLVVIGRPLFFRGDACSKAEWAWG